MSLSERFKDTEKSKKYRFALISLLTAVAGFAIASLLKTDISMFSAFITGIVSIYTAYNVGNVTNKWVISKTPVNLAKPDSPVEEEK